MSNKSHNTTIIVGLIIVVVSFAFAASNTIVFISLLVVGGACVFLGMKDLDN